MIKGHYQTRKIFINDKELLPNIIINRSFGGFSWGYGGSGPSQLALALILHYFPRWLAEKYYQDFKFKWVARLPQNDFEIDEGNLVAIVFSLLTADDSDRFLMEAIG